jgi:sRNA-binding protein
MTTKLIAVMALCVLIAACEPATEVTKPAASPTTQSTTPAPSPSPEATAPTAAWKAGDKVKVTINGKAVEATVVSIDEKALKATVKVQGETKERTVNLADIVKQ